MPDLFPLPVVAAVELGPRQVLLTLDASGSAIAKSHTRPGQYVKLKTFRDDVARPFAIATKPHAGTGPVHLEFLIKAEGDRRAHLLGLGGLAVGDRLSSSLAEGDGYDLPSLHHRDLWLIASGTGIAPIRAALDAIVDDRPAFGAITLLYGVQKPEELAFAHRFGTWAGLGVKVVPIVSRPDANAWQGAVGYVQDHLDKALPRPDATTVLLCGPPAMETAVEHALLQLGVGPDTIVRNW